MNIVVYAAAATEPLTLAEVRDHLRLDVGDGEVAPGAPLVALAGAGAGNVDNGAHRYAVTFVTADGETEYGTPSAVVTVADKTANGKVSLTGISLGGSRVTARRLYRTAAGANEHKLLATLSDNTTTTYTDNIADASLGAAAPGSNSTSEPGLHLLIASARLAAEAELRRYLVTQTLDAYLDEFPRTCDRSIRLPPFQSVLAITYVDTDGNTQTLAADQYVADANSLPGRIVEAYGVSWPSTRQQENAVKVRFVAGYGTAGAVPACIKHWMLMKVAEIHPGVKEPMPPFINSLLDPERVTGRI